MSLLIALLVASATWLWWQVPLPRVQRVDPGVGRAPDIGDISAAAELLSLSLRSGCGVTEALEQVGELLGGVLGRHLTTVAAGSRWGLPDAQCWARLPAAWQPVAAALQLSGEAGLPPAGLLEAAAEDLRRAEAHRREVATARLGVRVVLPLGLAFLPAFTLTTVLPVVLALAGQVLGG